MLLTNGFWGEEQESGHRRERGAGRGSASLKALVQQAIDQVPGWTQ